MIYYTILYLCYTMTIITIIHAQAGSRPRLARRAAPEGEEVDSIDRPKNIKDLAH